MIDSNQNSIEKLKQLGFVLVGNDDASGPPSNLLPPFAMTEIVQAVRPTLILEIGSWRVHP